MVFMVFDTGIQRYLPAEKIINKDIRELQATARARRVEEDEAQQQGRHYQQRQAAAYRPPKKESKPLERALLAHQIMSTELTTLNQNASLAVARALFRQHRFRHVPVIQADGQLAGIFSDRDLMQHQNDDDIVPITKLMRQQVLVASPQTEIRELARVMYEQRVGAVPIVDDGEKLVGIVTRSDILRSLINHAPLELWV